MRRNFLIGSAVLFAILSAGDRASALGVTSKDQLMRSAWDSSYTAPGGRQVQARIQFNGDSGTYDTAFGQGRLSQVAYGFDTNPTTGEPFFQINGQWSFLGSSGPFIFSSAGGTNRFRGQWNGNDGRSGEWTGRLAAAAAGVPLGAAGGGPGQSFGFTFTQWQFYPGKNYYLRTCTYPDGAYFYAIYKPAFTVNYIFCYNPYKQRYWCCCPTVNNSNFNVVGNSVSIFIVILNIDNATTVENSAIPDNPAANAKNSVPLKNANGDPIATLNSMPTDIPPG